MIEDIFKDKVLLITGGPVLSVMLCSKGFEH